jgi:REP element-mobilizing transposase RayT
MPEQVHLLMNEPEHSNLAQAMKSLKQGVARRLALGPRIHSGKRGTTISMSGASASLSRSFATSTAIP